MRKDSKKDEMTLRIVGNDYNEKNGNKADVKVKSESEIDEQRLTNLDWLDDLSDWLDEQKRLNNYPQLPSGKIVKGVSSANALTYQESEDGSVSVYALQLYFNIRKEN